MKKVAVAIHAIEDFTPDIIQGIKNLDYIHVDVMDGKFVETKTDNLEVFKILKENYDLPIIAHLMVSNPMIQIEEIKEYIDIILFHYESGGNRDLIIDNVKNLDKKVGIAINPDTPLTKILSFLNRIDIVLIMSVVPGKSGQTFMWEMLDKLNLLYAYRHQNDLKFKIDIDGGINVENAKLIYSDIITSTSAILDAENPNEVIQSLKG